jgi:hypothetical protein
VRARGLGFAWLRAGLHVSNNAGGEHAGVAGCAPGTNRLQLVLFGTQIGHFVPTCQAAHLEAVAELRAEVAASERQRAALEERLAASSGEAEAAAARAAELQQAVDALEANLGALRGGGGLTATRGRRFLLAPVCLSVSTKRAGTDLSAAQAPCVCLSAPCVAGTRCVGGRQAAAVARQGKVGP